MKGVALTICLQNEFVKLHKYKEGATKKLSVCVYFFLSQRKEAGERIKHLCYQCELLSDLSEPPQ